jgi:hypothetical protein
MVFLHGSKVVERRISPEFRIGNRAFVSTHCLARIIHKPRVLGH